MCIFFNWVCRKGGEVSGHLLGCSAYNETLVILQKSQRFKEELQVLDEMSKKGRMVSCLIDLRLLIKWRKQLVYSIGEKSLDWRMTWLRFKNVEYHSQWLVRIGECMRQKGLEIIVYKCEPDMFTRETFIKALTKNGKLGTAIKLF
ncbi:hypothetical protein CFP56_035559 [Quercus suber]|uniref:Uncharacterized protein n=1 Tax=Quercus suber TaxID=58331 RepID=A0AAW0LRE3_QUESU